MKNPLKRMYRKDGEDRLLPKFSLFIFDRSRTAAIIWLCLTLFGIISYTTLLKRQGFPSINIPFSVASGTYFVNDASKVDARVAKPISDIALKQDGVKSVQTSSQGNYYTVFIQYEEKTNADVAGKKLLDKVAAAGVLPSRASLNIQTPKFGFTERGDDGVVSVYSQSPNTKLADLTAEGDKVATFVKSKHLQDIKTISVIDPLKKGTDPVTGLEATTQLNFDRYGERANSQNTFYESIAVGYTQTADADVIDLDTHLRTVIDEYNKTHASDGYTAVVSAGSAHDIKDQIGELQRALLEGLLAVLVIGSIVIAVRASIITVIAMATVLSIVLGVLFLVGYTLNTITLFSLILCLGLIVDDTIIMVEAIDAQRRRKHDPRETVHEATRKVSRAMVAATSTAALSFAPLLFVGGILGSFIRAIPITVITSLLVSLTVALVFIPLFARYLLLGKKQMGAENMHEPAAGIEARIASFIGKPMLWARHHRKRLFSVGIIAVVIGFGFIGAGMALFSKVTFNIFPPSKDSNGLMATMTFEPGTTIEQAEKLADQANQVIARKLGENLTQASYFENANTNTATMQIGIISYKDRDVRAPELVDQLNADLKHFQGARVKLSQQDIGPPAAAFTVRLETNNRPAALKLAADINKFLDGRELTRPSGTKAKITESSISDPGSYTRADSKLYLSVTANFKDTDTTTLVTLAQKAVEKEFTPGKLTSYGLKKDVLNFDFGQEDENQDSFKSLAMAFPILLLAIFLLLAIQFRSLAQPLLIFMAIPFSLFGITLGLYLTKNAFSFFAMLGFFALIGLSIKNTILLTDYANQLRRQGMPAVDAAVGALSERFRPLIATSFTAVVSLIPLAITSPFWEGLAVVLIFGLLSSTFLVITVFPYYYLGAEYLRLRVTRKACLLWLALSVGLVVLLVQVAPKAAPLAPIVVLIVQLVLAKLLRKKKAA